ncbi:MAG TPA: hypothetical protein VE175_10270, partial [Woeseiaceae bacterium]|nr:hypothetical protein [Woeseiaceae bacterium]
MRRAQSRLRTHTASGAEPAAAEGPGPCERLQRPLRHAAAPLAVLAVWLLLHPYHGIGHDARIYAASALRSVRPALVGNDFFLS